MQGLLGTPYVKGLALPVTAALCEDMGMEYKVDYEFKLAEIPKQPGCYIFKNKFQHIIYIGKSKLLYNRIKQHINHNDASDYKHIDLMKELKSIEIITTDTETNALILECQLIKQHKPKYNSQLKRGREFPFIRVDIQQTYPTLTIADNIVNDGCKYFGSFYDRDDAHATLELINSVWQTPLCCKESFNKVQRPCLNYHLDKCSAPCAGKIDATDYCKTVDEVLKCLSGNFSLTFQQLNRKMKMASNEMRFERAAQLRDIILGLKKLKKKQRSLYTDLANKDVYLFFRAIREKCFTLFFIKNGVTVNRINFPSIEELDKEKLRGFISDNTNGVCAVEDGEILTSYLLEIGANKLFIPISQRTNEVNAGMRLEKAFKDFQR